MSERTRLQIATVLCLCCGSRYAIDGDCPNVDDGRHDAERALLVARYLLDERGVEHPTSADIRAAVVALEETSDA